MSISQDLDALLLRIVPRLAIERKGASPEEIERLKERAGRPLPELYLWFLSTMGGSMGAARFGNVDFSAQRVLATPKPSAIPSQYVLIGHGDDDFGYHYYYDLDHPARDDARVEIIGHDGDILSSRSETLAEMLAWGNLWDFRVRPSPQRCEGMIETDGEFKSTFDPVMESLEFKSPIETGWACALWERGDAALISSVDPTFEPDGAMPFALGGSDAGLLRKILGAIACQPSISVRAYSWTPSIGEDPNP